MKPEEGGPINRYFREELNTERPPEFFEPAPQSSSMSENFKLPRKKYLSTNSPSQRSASPSSFTTGSPAGLEDIIRYGGRLGEPGDRLGIPF